MHTPDLAELAHDAWKEHHSGCETCGQHDWFNPGMPRIGKKGEKGGKLITTKSGEKVRIIWEADVDVLCEKGSYLFRSWLQACSSSSLGNDNCTKKKPKPKRTGATAGYEGTTKA